jgi:hypothetical protein
VDPGALSTISLIFTVRVAHKAEEDSIIEESASHEHGVLSPRRPSADFGVLNNIGSDHGGSNIHKVRPMEHDQASQH